MSAPVPRLLDLLGGLRLQEAVDGEVLIAEGSEPGQMLVLASGEVTIERDGIALARIDTPGAVFGEMSVVLDQPATATVRAAGDVVLNVVDDPVAFLSDNPGAALAVLRMTAARLDGMTQYLSDVKHQLADSEGHLGMVGQVLDTLLHHHAAPVRTGSARDPDHAH